MDGVREIPLSRGLVTLVDEADYEWLSQWKWSALKTGQSEQGVKFYAVRTVGTVMLLMHRVILGAESGIVVDHRDNDGLNNRRINLRSCTQAKNALNRRGYLTGHKTSRFKGVSWHRDRCKWVAEFRGRYLGIFANEIEAARKYDSVALAYSPEFALINFPNGG